MKREFLFLLLFIAAMVGCQHADDSAVMHEYVTLKAHHGAVTRVVFDGEKSEWSEGDNLSILVEGLDDIYKFNYDTSSDNNFICDNLILPATENDIYAFYGVHPTCINVAERVTTIDLSAAIQFQDTQKPTSHIAEYDVLYGKALVVAKNNISIAMEHTIVAVKVNITNSLPESKMVESITFSVPENVALYGNYNINLSMDTMDAISLEGNNSVQLTFDEPQLLEDDDVFVAWIATVPFALVEGDVLTIDITTVDDEVYRCTKNISDAGVVFNAGTIMTTDITLGGNASIVEPDAPAEPELLQEINIEINPAVTGVIPDDFPKSVKANVKSGEFLLNGYNFVFESEVPFYCTGSGRIRFEGITSAKTASILLPHIGGYVLSKVTLASIDDNRNRGYRFAVLENLSDDITVDNYEILTSKHEEFNVNLSGSDSDCYVYVYHNKSSIANKYADLAYISLTYTLLENE